MQRLKGRHQFVQEESLPAVGAPLDKAVGLRPDAHRSIVYSSSLHWQRVGAPFPFGPGVIALARADSRANGFLRLSAASAAPLERRPCVADLIASGGAQRAPSQVGLE